MLTKLREQFSKLQDKYPDVSSELISLVRANVMQSQPSQPHLPPAPPFNMSELEMFHPLVQQERSRLTLLSSMRSFYNIPMFRSNLSIFGEEP